jgi:hypothetical protein
MIQNFHGRELPLGELVVVVDQGKFIAMSTRTPSLTVTVRLYHAL